MVLIAVLFVFESDVTVAERAHSRTIPNKSTQGIHSVVDQLQEVPEMYGLKCDEKTGLPWVVCDGADNEKTNEYSSKEPMQRMTFQVPAQ